MNASKLKQVINRDRGNRNICFRFDTEVEFAEFGASAKKYRRSLGANAIYYILLGMEAEKKRCNVGDAV